MSDDDAIEWAEAWEMQADNAADLLAALKDLLIYTRSLESLLNSPGDKMPDHSAVQRAKELIAK